MRGVKLFPFVYKIKGVKNWALYDLMRGKIFQISPGNNIEKLKDQLLNFGLAFRTEGIVPFKFRIDVDKYKKMIQLRELQIRLTGKCNSNCENCGNICSCFKGDGAMEEKTLNIILKQLKYIPTENILITGGNPLLEFNRVIKLRKEIKTDTFELVYKGQIDKKQEIALKKLKVRIKTFANDLSKKNEEKLSFDSFSFFYNQSFNPCWGNIIAIDIDGSIKPCLWSDIILGNIKKDNLKELISTGIFDQYWELKKDKFTTCKLCEYRYACSDCRVVVKKNSGSFSSKTMDCSYDPNIGEWK